MRPSKLGLLVLAMVLSLGVHAQGAAGVELLASWANGEGGISANSHVRTEQVGAELSALFNQPTREFRGKIGPCVKRIVLKYPSSREPDARYFFAAGNAIQLAPSKDRSGRLIQFVPGRWPATAQLLSEAQPSKSCKGDA